MKRAMSIAAMVAAVVWTTVTQAEGPTTQPVASIGIMEQRTLKGFTYFYTSVQTTIPEIPTKVDKLMEDLMNAMKSSHMEAMGAPVFIYHGMTGDPNQRFTLEVGFPVNDDAKAPAGEFKLRKIEDFACATALYAGPMSRIGEVYGKLMPALFGAGLRPTEQLREYYLYWEGKESDNNVVWVVVGVEK